MADDNFQWNQHRLKLNYMAWLTYDKKLFTMLLNFKTWGEREGYGNKIRTKIL
jgi:hypothetical protein